MIAYRVTFMREAPGLQSKRQLKPLGSFMPYFRAAALHLLLQP